MIDYNSITIVNKLEEYIKEFKDNNIKFRKELTNSFLSHAFYPLNKLT